MLCRLNKKNNTPGTSEDPGDGTIAALCFVDLVCTSDPLAKKALHQWLPCFDCVAIWGLRELQSGSKSTVSQCTFGEATPARAARKVPAPWHRERCASDDRACRAPQAAMPLVELFAVARWFFAAAQTYRDRWLCRRQQNGAYSLHAALTLGGA